MILFWLICALFIVIALAFVLPPLFETEEVTETAGQREANIAVYRDQISELEADVRNGLISKEQYQQEHEELERRLLEDVAGADVVATKQVARKITRMAIYAIGLAVPLAAVLIYLQVGNRQAIAGPPPGFRPPAGIQAQGSQPRSQEQIEASVAALAKRLEQSPNDVDGWRMLANSYMSMERYSDAARAFEKASALKPNDADLLADYAFSLAMTNDRRLQGRPQELLQKALQLDPENSKVLQLAGGAAYEAKNFEQAIVYWEKLLAKTPRESELGQLVAQRIADARAQAGKN
jgi:cytochrome c-type biogenesis protein CcmH